jgi:DNA-binding NtrC family response regulator
VREGAWNGPATLGELQKLNPALPCVFGSGNIGLSTEGELIDLGAIAVLTKPIDSRQLAGILATVQPGPSSDTVSR